MVIGVVIGIAAGLLVGLAWHLVRSARASTASQVAEARLADAKLTMTEQSVQLQALSEAAATAQRAQAVASAELELVRGHEVEAADRAEEDMGRLTGAFATLSREALAKNNE